MKVVLCPLMEMHIKYNRVVSVLMSVSCPYSLENRSLKFMCFNLEDSNTYTHEVEECISRSTSTNNRRSK